MLSKRGQPANTDLHAQANRNIAKNACQSPLPSHQRQALPPFVSFPDADTKNGDFPFGVLQQHGTLKKGHTHLQKFG